MSAWFSIQSINIRSVQLQRDLILFDSWYYRFIAKFINKGFDREWLFSIFDAVIEPDIVVMLDIDPQKAWKRRSKFNNIELGKWDGIAGNKFKSYCKYQEHIRKTLLQFAKEKSWVVVHQEAGTTTDEICYLVCDQVLSRIRG